jgi:hypothetical protein
MDTYRKCSLFFECNCKCLYMTYSWFYNYRSRRIYCAGITVPPDVKRTHQPSGELPVAPYGTGAHQGLQWTSPRLVMKRIGTLLREELQGLMTDAAVDDRTQHLLNKSRQSFQLLMENSRGSTGSGKHMSEGKSSARLSSRMSGGKSSAWLSSRMIRGKSSTSLSSQMKRASLAAGNTYGTDEGNVQ